MMGDDRSSGKNGPQCCRIIRHVTRRSRPLRGQCGDNPTWQLAGLYLITRARLLKSHLPVKTVSDVRHPPPGTAPLLSRSSTKA
jgi:hypothetical protein